MTLLKLNNTAVSKKDPVKILMVEDDPLDALLLKNILQTSSSSPRFEVHHCKSLKETIQHLRTSPQDVILLDLSLPDSTGIPTLQQLHLEAPDLPIVIITGLDDEQTALRALREGAQDYLVKGQTDHRMLTRIIQYAMGRQHAEDEIRIREESLRRIIDTTQEGVWTFDTEGKTTFANQRLSSLLKMDGSELMGRSVLDFVESSFTDTFKNILRLLNMGIRTTEDIQLKTSSAPPTWVHLTANPLYHRNGHLIGALAMVADLTERRRLEKEVQDISEREQRRIGQDLHDSLCQQLAGVTLLCKAVEKQVGNRQSELAQDIKKIRELVQATVGQARDLAKTLYPVELESQGLNQALIALSEHSSHVFKIQCRVCTHTRTVLKNLTVCSQLYRISQEAIHNSVRHGKAQNVTIEFSKKGSQGILKIIDDGPGFSHSMQSSKGMGIRIMKYRAQLIGATLNLSTQKEGGACVLCRFPWTNVTSPS